MNWIDYVIGGVLLLMAFLFSLGGGEGSGVAVFRAFALVVSVWTAHHFGQPVSDGLGLSPLLAYILLFVIVAFLLLLASARLHDLLPLDLTPFNGIIKFVFGLVAGWAICFGLLDAMTKAVAHDSSVGQAMTSSELTPEILHFRTLTNSKARLDSTSFKPRDPWEQPPAFKPK